jgi:copper(I)-binding protein
VIRASSGKTTACRLLIGAGVLALLVPAIAGCEAGENAPTLEFHPASAGAQTVFNGIRITNAFVLGAPSGSSVASGSSASLFLSLYNGRANADKLMSASAAGSATSVALSGTTVTLPVGSAVNLTGPQPSVVLSSLTQPLVGGSYVPVTLDFEHAGSVTLQVPVEAQSYDFSTYSAPASPAPSASTAAATPTSAATKSAEAKASATPTA